MEMIRSQLENNEYITDAGVRKVLQKYKYRIWNNDERGKFVEAVKKYGKKPSLISMHVGTKDRKKV